MSGSSKRRLPLIDTPTFIFVKWLLFFPVCPKLRGANLDSRPASCWFMCEAGAAKYPPLEVWELMLPPGVGLFNIKTLQNYKFQVRQLHATLHCQRSLPVSCMATRVSAGVRYITADRMEQRKSPRKVPIGEIGTPHRSVKAAAAEFPATARPRLSIDKLDLPPSISTTVSSQKMLGTVYRPSTIPHIISLSLLFSTRMRSRAMSSLPKSSSDALANLHRFTACDISDALLKLKVPEAGFLPDLIPYTTPRISSSDLHNPRQITVAPASTILFIPKDSDGAGYPPGNIPPGEHWVDSTTPGTFVVGSQPEGQRNAVLGGIMAARMAKLDARGVLIHGRIRDVEELKEINMMIWAKGTSTVGQGLASKAHAHNVPITISGVNISPNDIIFSDPSCGVVVIPAGKLPEVLELLPRIVQADERVMEAVKTGMMVKDAFSQFRKAL